MSFENILLEIDNSIALITINRPTKLNALNKSTIKELHFALKQLNDDNNTRAIIITGSGEKAFIAGADISEFSNFSAKQGQELSSEGHYLLFDFIENLSTPVIAAINGFALGGGLELAMACHFRVASDNSKMGLPEVSLGLIPGYGGTQRLPQLVGKGIAMEMIMTGGMINAEQAISSSLINYIVTLEELIPFCRKIASKIINNSPIAIAAAIKSINSGYKKEGFQTEINAFGKCFETEDFKEGVAAFLEKRKAEFKGK